MVTVEFAAMQPDVSVVISTFRRPRQLVEALGSALAQLDVDLEVVVVDDSPEGSARSAVEGVGDPRVRYLQMPAPSGGKPSRVRNHGWPHTTGHFVHFLDDDDRVPQGTYRTMIEALRKHPDRGVVFGRIDPFGDDPRAIRAEQSFFRQTYRRARLAGRLGSRRVMVANMLFLKSFLVTSACMIRRECIESVGGYDPDIAVVEDLDFFGRVIRRFGCVFLDEVVLEYRISANSLMHGDTGHSQVVDAYQKMHRRYREAWGVSEFLGLKLLARGLLQFW